MVKISKMKSNEFAALLSDLSKKIDSDITWGQDEDHSPSVEFRVEVESEAGYPLFVRGSYNALAGALSYTLIHRGYGRIYALDLGKEHHNPSCQQVGEKHKHSWTERFGDKEAYAPPDITAPVHDPVQVWAQFCREANIQHHGVMHEPPPFTEEML